ncbi:MAG: DUF1634 domain-containing protein [Flavobacteriaceae bacterium]|nr:DUF1634 domain-containing protein [Flavobacteriaceae bacterium]
MRVLLSFVGFAMEKDKMYVVITAIVLSVILSNMFWGNTLNFRIKIG